MAIQFIGNPKDVRYNKKILLALFEELIKVSNILQGINEGAFNDIDPDVLKEDKEALNYRQQYLIDQILDYMFLPRHIINDYSDIHEMMNDLFNIPYWMTLEHQVEEYINYITKEHCCSICGSEVSIGDKYCSACANEEENLATEVFNNIANSIRNTAILFEEAVVRTNPCGEIILTSDNHREADQEPERSTNEPIYAELTEDDLRELAHSLYSSYR